MAGTSASSDDSYFYFSIVGVLILILAVSYVVDFIYCLVNFIKRNGLYFDLNGWV